MGLLQSLKNCRGGVVLVSAVGQGDCPSSQLKGEYMNQFRCALVGAASFDKEHFLAQDFDEIIAVDGGYAALLEAGVAPDFALGDFDSLGYVPKGVPIEKHPSMKDDSDTALAIDWARLHGAGGIAVYGALGGRLDHTLASVAALVNAARSGVCAVAVGEGSAVVVLASGMSLSLPAYEQGTFSVFSACDVSRGVRESGSLYEVDGIDLPNDVTLGLSNEFKGEPVRISVAEGALVVVLPAVPLADIVVA